MPAQGPALKGAADKTQGSLPEKVGSLDSFVWGSLEELFSIF
jgi:hypothetical protein